MKTRMTQFTGLLVGILLWPIGNAHAALLSPADRSAVQQQQQLLLDQNQRQRDELERSTVLPRTPSSPALTPPDGRCFVISRIVLDGTTVMPEAAQSRLTAPGATSASIWQPSTT